MIALTMITATSIAKAAGEDIVKIKLVRVPSAMTDGGEYKIRWITENAPKGATVDIRVIPPYGLQLWWGYNLLYDAPPTGNLKFIPRTLGERAERYRLVATLYLRGGNGERIKIAETTSKVFTIRLKGPKRSLTLIAPTYGDALYAGDPYVIQWESVNLPAGAKIRLEIWPVYWSDDSDSFYQEVPNIGGFVWEIPANFNDGEYVMILSWVTETGMPGVLPVDTRVLIKNIPDPEFFEF